jgi:hypothetical protein
MDEPNVQMTWMKMSYGRMSQIQLLAKNADEWMRKKMRLEA